MNLHTQPVKALIFDLDGTLIHSLPYHGQSWLVFAQRHGLQIDLAELMLRTNGRNGLECIRVLLGEHLSDEQTHAFALEKEAIYRELFKPHFAQVAGATSFIQAARDRGLKTGLGTAGDAANVAFALDNLRFPFQFDAISRGDEGGPGKPEPDIFLRAAQRMGVAPEHCVVFEDAPLGIEAARRAGMRAVGICTTSTPAQLAGPHVLAAASNFEQLPPDFLGELATTPIVVETTHHNYNA